MCLLSIPHFEKTGDFSYPLPNMLNMSFYPAVVLKMALVIIPLSTYVKLNFWKQHIGDSVGIKLPVVRLKHLVPLVYVEGAGVHLLVTCSSVIEHW